jgi:hypothetical protein
MENVFYLALGKCFLPSPAEEMDPAAGRREKIKPEG